MTYTTTPTDRSAPRPAAPQALLALLTAAVLAGCAVAPQPATPDLVRERVTQDLAGMYAGQEPVSGAITLEEAIARGLKYNLDYRLKKMEAALALGLTETASADMLPKLVANAGYRSRSNDSGGYSRGIDDGLETTRPTSSDDRRHSLAGVEFSWNALDFGVSYYRARQMSDQFLIAEERRRKVVQNIVQDVRASYWRALGAQRLNARANEVLTRARQALARSREAELQKIIPPVTALNYQRALLEATQQINQRRQDLDVAKRELAALMNVPSGVDFSIAEAAEPTLPEAPTDLGKMEEWALLQRPELREEDYRKRISAHEVRRQMLSVLPGISFDTAIQYDSNHLAYNNRWAQGGVRLSWDLLRLASLPAMGKAQKAQAETDQTRRMALSMAVVTQLRVGVERYRLALEDFRLSEEASRVEQRSADYARASVTAKLDSELESIRTQARALVGAYQRTHAYAAAQIAYGRLYNTLGYDPLPQVAIEQTLPELKQRVREQLKANETDAYRFSSQLFGLAPAPVAVRIQGVDDDAQRVRMAAEVGTLLGRQGLVIDPDKGTPLTLSLTSTAVDAGLQRNTWVVSLGANAGSELRHSALMPAGARDSAQAAALMATINLNLSAIRQWAGAQAQETAAQGK